MKFNMDIPLKFLDYQRKIKPALEAKGIKQSHVYRALGMSQSTWLRRLKNNSFTVQEVIEICKAVNK